MRANGMETEKLIGKLIEEVFEISNEKTVESNETVVRCNQNNKVINF
jgi:hypothetical protein